MEAGTVSSVLAASGSRLNVLGDSVLYFVVVMYGTNSTFPTVTQMGGEFSRIIRDFGKRAGVYFIHFVLAGHIFGS